MKIEYWSINFRLEWKSSRSIVLYSCAYPDSHEVISHTCMRVGHRGSISIFCPFSRMSTVSRIFFRIMRFAFSPSLSLSLFNIFSLSFLSLTNSLTWNKSNMVTNEYLNSRRIKRHSLTFSLLFDVSLHTHIHTYVLVSSPSNERISYKCTKNIYVCLDRQVRRLVGWFARETNHWI